MFKNKKYLFFFSFLLFIFSTNNTFAGTSISSLLLNGVGQSVTFNPSNGESISIEVKSSVPVKFTRMYICSTTQVCNGTSGNYTRYFTQSDVSDTISKVWNGKKSGDTEIVPDGEYKVMASMTEGTNDPVLEFGSYSIFVNSSSINQPTSSSSDITNTDISSTPNVSYVTRTVYVSTHSDQENLSNYTESILSTSAGRPRMALVGSIIDFSAKYSVSKNIQCTPYFRWVFGDGFDGIGKDIKHSYKYGGEYNLVLNTTCGEYSSVSRTSVKVLVPEIEILSLKDGDIEIFNKGDVEVNIGNWKIKGGIKDFILPRDTIISSNDSIILSKEDIGNTENITNISLINQIDREVAFYSKELIKDDISFKTDIFEPNISLEQAELLVSEYKQSLHNNSQIVKESPKNVENKEDFALSNIDSTATALDAVDNLKNSGFWSTIISLPIRGIKSLINKFYIF